MTDTVPFLDALEAADRKALLALGRPRRYPAGATLFAEGDGSDFVLVLVEGHVKVFCTTPDGREPVLAVRDRGDLLGELAAIDDGAAARAATVVAMSPVVTRQIPADEFRELVATRPGVAIALLRMLTARLRGADRRRVEFGGYDTPHRLAALLAELADEHGQPDGAGLRLGVALSQEELAGMIGASRESVARALTQLRADGLVVTRRRGITVTDVDRLRAWPG